MKKLFWIPLMQMLVVGSQGATAQANARRIASAVDWESYFSEPMTGAYAQQIAQIAGTSTCAKYSWKKRGRAPAGYMKGVAMSFGRSLCRLRVSGTSARAAGVMSAAGVTSDSKDSL